MELALIKDGNLIDPDSLEMKIIISEILEELKKLNKAKEQEKK